MERANHTPGPWQHWNEDHDGPFEIIPGEDLNEPPLCVVERPSDAYLIAAAPELLTVLQAAVNKGYMWDHDSDLWSQATAAIAKAKGQ